MLSAAFNFGMRSTRSSLLQQSYGGQPNKLLPSAVNYFAAHLGVRRIVRDLLVRPPQDVEVATFVVRFLCVLLE